MPGAVPSAPFRQTQQWVELGLKRAIVEAVNANTDLVSWTQGKDHAARYDKSIHELDKIEITKNENGIHYRVVATKNNSEIINQNNNKASLLDLVGKEMAQKAIDAKSGETITFEGDNLTLGDGRGFIGFYDKLLPSVAKDLLRKLDKKSRIQPIEIQTDDGNKLALAFPITDKIKNKVQTEGLPMFSTDTTPSDATTTDTTTPTIFNDIAKFSADNQFDEKGRVKNIWQHDDVEIVKINAPELKGSRAELRKLIRDHIANELQGKPPILNDDSQESVIFTKNSKRKSISRARKEIQFRPILNAEEIVKRAIRVSRETPEQNKNQDSKYIHHFMLPIAIDDDLYNARWSAKEFGEYQTKIDANKFLETQSAQILDFRRS